MQPKSILIVDDSKLARMMMRNIIAQSLPGWSILEAANGEEGLTIAQGNPPSLALVDFNMPGMNGLELAAKLMETLPELTIYLVTANVQEKMRQRAEAMGLGFIMKPISQEKLAEAVARIEGLNG